MMQDAQLLLSGTINGTTNAITPQTVTAAAVSGNTVDLLQARDLGEGTDLYGRFQVATAATGGTTMEFQIIAADDAALSTNITVLGTTGPIPLARLTAGARFACGISPVLGRIGQRYAGARYVPTGAFTAGAYVADIGIEVQDGQTFYPANQSII